RPRSAGLSRRASTVALFLEHVRRLAARDLDLAFDDRALGDCDRVAGQRARDARGARDLDALPGMHVALDRTGDDDVLGFERAAPARALGERHGAVDVAIAFDDAAEDERTAARDRADDGRGLRHECGRARRVVAN